MAKKQDLANNPLAARLDAKTDDLPSEWYPIDQIDIWPWLEKLRPWEEEEEEKSFQETIKEEGFNSTVLLRRKPNGRLELIAGLRRFRNQRKNEEKIRGHLYEGCSDSRAKGLALKENNQRKRLPKLLETEAIAEILQEELELSLEEVSQVFKEISSLRKKNDRAKKKGESEVSYNVIGHYEKCVEILIKHQHRNIFSFIANYWSLTKRPDPINDAIREGRMDESRVDAIAKAWKRLGEEAEDFLEGAIAEDWDMERIKKEIADRAVPKEKPAHEQQIETIRKRYSRLSPTDKKKVNGWLEKASTLCKANLVMEET